MALCKQCHTLCLELEKNEGIDEEFEASFRQWFWKRQFAGDPTPETIPQLNGLVHSSWVSFCDSLDEYCPVCWKSWRGMRSSASAAYRDEPRSEFCLWAESAALRKEVEGAGPSFWDVKLCYRWKTIYPIDGGVYIKRTSKQHFQDTAAQDPLEDHLASPRTFALVKSWLSQCSERHSGCRLREQHSLNKLRVPTRLIDVQGSQSKAWFLIETKNQSQDYSKYIALSHRWTDHTPKLLRENFTSFENGQSDHTVPPSYRDAFTLCRMLGIRYIWVDSLCIFQDSADDFLREAATMTDVYMNAICTFSICYESSLGVLRPRNLNSIPRWSAAEQEPIIESDSHAFVLDPQEWSSAVVESQLNRRGWVFQERLLSRGILYLGNDKLYWECDHFQACENEPQGFYPFFELRARWPVIGNESRAGFWNRLIESYMKLDLTFERDRLTAISGIARLLLGQTADEYIAGIRKSNWIYDLLWYPCLLIPWGVFNRHPYEPIPSWSWASCPGPIQWGLCRYELDPPQIPELPQASQTMNPLAYLGGSSLELLGNDVYGSPKSATLELSCLLIPAQAQIDSNRDLSKAWKSRPGHCQEYLYLTYEPSDGFSISQRYQRGIRDGMSLIRIPFDTHNLFTPTCFLLPLIHKGFAFGGLVIQERLQSVDSRVREFVRIGSFVESNNTGKESFLGVIVHNTLAKRVPDGATGSFESRVREYAQEQIAASKLWDQDRFMDKIQGEWTTISLV